MKFFPRPVPDRQAPAHLHRLAALETECRTEHFATRGPDEKARLATTQKVVEAVWAEGFAAGVAHALATMSTRYILVTEEERAKMIEELGE